MKTYLIALFLCSSGIAFGQLIDSVPPSTGTRTKAHIAQIQNRFRQSPPLPAGGFWVVEGQPKAPVIVHFYTDNQQELRTDTLTKKWVNLKRRAVIKTLNERLNTLLNSPQLATIHKYP